MNEGRAMRLLIYVLLAAFSWWLAAGSVAAASRSVWTYHYDNLRTGWNNQETVLSATTFPANFGVLATVALDDQVDAQPLLAPALTIAGGVHDVLYVVTQNNSVYALDAQSGNILATTNLGPPVPAPFGCNNNGPNIGITSTPVIDLSLQRIYVMAYVNGASPQYQLHALSLTTLADAVPSITVAASHKLTNGFTFSFNATYQRQRPALLERGGVIYAGFGSFCDYQGNNSRGWVLGWRASNLAQLPNSQLDDTQATSPTSFFLSSVWMSGYGLAANGDNIFFSTGNSDCNWTVTPEQCPTASTYDGVTNIQESVISLSPSLASHDGVFTPSNVLEMDIDDADLGASGVLLLPTQPGGANLAAIVSKDGRLFLLDQTNLATAQDMQQLANGCWCGPTYYQRNDGVGRVVTAAGALQTWQIGTSPTPHWVAETTTNTIPASEQDPGFFTTVSSNGGAPGSAIIWAVGRPTATTGLTLYAFSAAPVNGALPLLYSAPAGQWPNLGGNANIVPMVANGRVYVGAYKTLTIFGPGGAPPAAAAPAAADAALALAPASRRVTGWLLAQSGAKLTLLTRNAGTVEVDATDALAQRRAAPSLVIGEPYTAFGPVGGDATFAATAITRAKPGVGAWPSDR